jgi:hypothetical protein
MRTWAKILLKYGITTLVAALMMVGVFAIQGLFSDGLSTVEFYRILCNGFFVPGILLILVYFLVRISGAGGFDGISYAFYIVFVRFIPSKSKNVMKYGDYKNAKIEKRKGRSSVIFLFFVGLAFCLISIVFLILFYQVYDASSVGSLTTIIF